MAALRSVKDSFWAAWFPETDGEDASGEASSPKFFDEVFHP